MVIYVKENTKNNDSVQVNPFFRSLNLVTPFLKQDSF